jgi:hypothetical protein
LCLECRRSAEAVGLETDFDELSRKIDRRMRPEVVRRLCDDGLSYREVAEQTGYSERQVRNIANTVAGTPIRGAYGPRGNLDPEIA